MISNLCELSMLILIYLLIHASKHSNYGVVSADMILIQFSMSFV